ncbi:MAG: dihydrolipoamide dehydrogenase, partial [Firmicutes bacterium]|nr:dihydrolipoamide dehydrogenase [Bacillota bacterium]
NRMRAGGYNSLADNKNVTLFESEASFAGLQKVLVGGETIRSERIVIATGARPLIPALEGLERVDYLTSTTVMELQELPKSLIIIGGGLIALEFSQLFARLGVDVTILQRNQQLAPQLDRDIAAEISSVLDNEKVKIVTGAGVNRVGREGDLIFVETGNNNQLIRYSAEKLLIAAGRAPNSDLLNLELAGIKTDQKGFIIVDDHFKTSADGVWAIGDIIGGPMFTHKAWHDGYLLANYLIDGKAISPADRLIPFAVFTEPEIAGVGLSETQAREAGYNFKVTSYPFGTHGRNIVDDKLEGFIKLIYETEGKKLIGAQLIGPEAGELIHELIAAIYFGTKLSDLQNIIHIHPTLAEAINSAAFAE